MTFKLTSLLCVFLLASSVVEASSYSAEETHIFLWTSVILGAVAVFSVYMMMSMDNGRDSILYAKIVLDSEGSRN
jgi:hypothetical protein